MVVIVFGPFLCLVQLLVVLTHQSAPVRVGIKESALAVHRLLCGFSPRASQTCSGLSFLRLLQIGRNECWCRFCRCLRSLWLSRSDRCAGPCSRASRAPTARCGGRFQFAQSPLELNRLTRCRCQPQAIIRVQCTAFDGRVEQEVEAFDIRRQQREQIAHVAGRVLTIAGDALRKQDSLHNVQLRVIPRLEIGRQFVAQQPMIQKLFVLLILQIRQHNRAEEIGVLLVQEETQFVTRILRVLGPLLFGLQVRPAGQETELDQRGIATKRYVQRVDPAQTVVSFEFRTGNVAEHKLLFAVDHRDLLLLGVVLLWIKACGEAQIVRVRFDFRQ